MLQLVCALAILPGKEEAWRRFLQELLGTRRPAFEASRARLGIEQELVWCVEIGSLTVAVTCVAANGREPEPLQPQSPEAAFERWHRERLQELHGVEPARRCGPRLLPPVLDWSARR